MRTLVLSLLIACSAKSPPPSTAPSGSATGSAKPEAPYRGSKERGPCHDAHECKLRNLCGCSCEAVVFAAGADEIKCDESCPNPDPCKGHSLICDLATRTCGAIPPAP